MFYLLTSLHTANIKYICKYIFRERELRKRKSIYFTFGSASLENPDLYSN